MRKLCNNPRMPVLLVLLASALFGTTGTAQVLGLPSVDPFIVGALRLAVGGSLLGLVALLLSRFRSSDPPLPGGSMRPLVLLVLAGAVGVTAYQPTFFEGVRINGVAGGTLLALGSAPVFTGLLTWAFHRRRPPSRWFLCTSLAVIGVVLLSGLLDGPTTHVGPEGAVASLTAGASYAVYTLAVKGLLDRGWSTLRAVGAVFGTAGLVGLAEISAAGGVALDWAGLLAAGWLGVATVAVAYLLFGRGLRQLSAPTVSTTTLAEPVVATVLGVLLLGETISAPALAGAALLIVALVLLGGRATKPRPPGVPAETDVAALCMRGD